MRVELEKLVKRFDAHVVLRGVTFAAQSGERIALETPLEAAESVDGGSLHRRAFDAATEWVEANGGSRAPAGDISEHGEKWRVLRDPEGNEFCVWFS